MDDTDDQKDGQCSSEIHTEDFINCQNSTMYNQSIKTIEIEMKVDEEFVSPDEKAFLIVDYNIEQADINVDLFQGKLTSDIHGETQHFLDALETKSNILGKCEPAALNTRIHDVNSSIKVNRRKRKYNFPHILILEEQMETTTYELDVSIDSAILNIYNQNIKVDIKDLRSVNHLGEGGSGSVSKVYIEKPPQTCMAVKRIRLNDKRKVTTQTELETLKKLGTGECPYIIGYYGAMIDSDGRDLCVYMELMDITAKTFYETMHVMGGDILANHLESYLLRFIHDVVSGLYFMETNNFVHRDVKPENILVNKTAQFKICDFGISIRINETDSTEGSVEGTIRYLPPIYERTESNRHTIQSDMWALGMSLAEMVYGKHPFQGPYEFELTHKIKPWDPDVPATYISSELRCFILHLLEKNPEKRPMSYSEILQWPFIKNMSKTPNVEESIFYSHVIEMSHLLKQHKT